MRGGGEHGAAPLGKPLPPTESASGSAPPASWTCRTTVAMWASG